MKLLFLDAYFNPEKIAFTHLESDLIEAFVDAGHEIIVICPSPTRGIDRETAEKYKKLKYEELYDGKVRIHRFWAPQEGENPVIRAFRYLWSNLREHQIGKKFKDTDLIFANSTPPTQGYIAGKLKKRLKCRFVYSLQDIFPDSLVTTGLTRENSILWNIGRKIENKTYQACDKIFVISNAMMKDLRAKGVTESKLVLISNWVDTEVIKPISRRNNKLISEYGIDPDKFLVVYAGNFGAAQGAEMILKAAEKLKAEQQIQFIIFGGGTEFASAKAIVKDRELANVMIHPLLPQDRVPEVYSLGDVALITCKSGVGGSGMPSKTWSIMACNTPIIASFDTESELAEIISKAGAGKCVEPGNADKLAEAIINQYKEGKSTCHSRRFVEQYASKKICVERYVKALEDAKKIEIGTM
jgi:glycosyltransferase involved in cell wall biosynthesis